MAQHADENKQAARQPSRSVAAAYLALLADRGIDYLFGNAGTDFAPLIEAYAEAFTDQSLIIFEAYMDNFNIIGTVLRLATIRIESPMHSRIPLTTFNEQIDPFRPSAEIGDEHY